MRDNTDNLKYSDARRARVAAARAPRPDTAILREENASVSVIIPAYRASATICRAINSVLEQTEPPHEILVIDDGSPEDLRETIAHYGDRVTLFRKPNGGAASARNYGIDRATGEFIAFLDADDYWEPTKLERQLVAFRDSPQVGVVAGRSFTEAPGRERVLAPWDGPELLDRALQLSGKNAFEVAARIWTGTVMVRRSLLAVERFAPGLEPAEDRDLWVRLVAIRPVYLISEPLATAVLEPGSLSRSDIERDCSNMLRVIAKHRKLIGATAARYWRSRTYLRWAGQERRPVIALQKLAYAFVLWPWPYPYSSARASWARPRAFAVAILRLARLRAAS